MQAPMQAVVLAAWLVPGGAVAQRPARVPVMPSIEARVQRLERQLSAGALGELLNRLEAIDRNVQSMRGDLEIQAHDIEELRKRQSELFVSLDRLGQKVKALAKRPPAAVTERPSGESGPASGGQGSAPSPPGTVAAAPGARAGPVNPSPASAVPPESTLAPAAGGAKAVNSLEEQDAYSAAFALLKQGRYAKAVDAFKQFLTKHPDGQYTDNAQYWLGEAYYVTRQFPAAMKEFTKLLAQHPESRKVPGAKLKIGFIYQELGKSAEARKTLEDLVKTYPDTPAARLARDRLRRLESD